MTRKIPSKRVGRPKERAPHLTDAGGDFADLAEAIRSGYLERKAAQKRPMFETKESFLKREAYDLIRAYARKKGGAGTIKNVVLALSKRRPVRVEYVDNPFFWGLIAIDWQDQMDIWKKVNLYAPLLLYAHLHDVPSEYLIGFLYQCGHPAVIRKRVRNNEREQGFLDFRRNSENLIKINQH